MIRELFDRVLRDSKRSFWERMMYASSEMAAPMSELLISAAWAAGVFETDRAEYEESVTRITSEYARLLLRVRKPCCFEP